MNPRKKRCPRRKRKLKISPQILAYYRNILFRIPEKHSAILERIKDWEDWYKRGLAELGEMGEGGL